MPDQAVIGPLQEGDLDEAMTIVRHAFGTFTGAPDLAAFWADRDLVRSRWQAAHVASFGAKLGGALAGSNFATRWGSVGYFGPLTVRPDLWDRDIGRQLMTPVMAQFDDWRTAHTGLFTFADSPKHIRLYEKFGFAARFLTAVMATAAVRRAGEWHRYGALPEERRQEALAGCREVTDAIFAGLDLGGEIDLVHRLKLGDTALVADEVGISGFAICHHGRASEAGDGVCLVKFAAVRPGPRAATDFDRLIDACETLAAEAGAATVVAGCNMGRSEAYRRLSNRCRTMFQGVTMHRPNEPGYSRPDAWIVDDWR